METGTFLVLLLTGQLTLVILDFRERYRTRHDRAGLNPIRPASVLFMVGVIIAYGGLQFGGLALVPDAEELLAFSQTFVSDMLNTGGGEATLPLIVFVGIAGFYFAGLCDYLFHRFVSHSRPMWWSHEYHHLTTDVSVFMPGLCVRPFAVVAVFPTMAVAIFTIQLFLGVADNNAWDMMPMLYAVVLAQTAVLGITHSAYLRRFWRLHRLLKPLGITTPQEHWLHHTSDLDCNYGNFTILWDRLFGTYVDPESEDITRHRAGLAYDQDFLGALTLGKFKFSDSLRRRFQLNQFCYLKSPS